VQTAIKQEFYQAWKVVYGPSKRNPVHSKQRPEFEFMGGKACVN